MTVRDSLPITIALLLALAVALSVLSLALVTAITAVLPRRGS